MSTEPGGVESDSNTDFSENVSRFEYGVAQTSETLADAVSSQAQDLVVKLTGVERKGCLSAGDDKNVDSHGDNLCNVVDSDAKSGDIGEKKNLGGSGNVGVALAGSNLLKRNDKNGFNASANENLRLFESDLVWAKVRSYPWWPGQVFDASFASKKAMKHFKKGSLLVAYFGDSTFAWNNASQINPFHQNFSQMQGQSNSAEFRDAIDCALEEVSRRVEFGLSCPCSSEEAYNKVKIQTILNLGIREDSHITYGGDKLSNALSFKPAKFLEYMKHLACSPSFDGTGQLQFVYNRAQLLAFQQWKSYFNFPKYETFINSVESAAPPKASLLEQDTFEGMPSKKRKTEYKDNAEHNQRFDSKTITGSGEQSVLKDCSAVSSAPNALILNFADSGSIPSIEKLNDIFNRFGPLQESKTQLMKKGKRAKVVFKRGEDAKTAFSSSGKYSIFGPSLLSYKLKYVCPKVKESNNMTTGTTL